MSTVVVILLVLIVNLICCYSVRHKIHIENEEYYELPRFWTNTGFCPATSSAISESLLTNDVRLHLNLIGALPNNGISTIRVHWLLDLLKFRQFRVHNNPEYDFDDLDTFLNWINDAGLAVGFEFMGNPGSFDQKKVPRSFLWKDLSFQIAERYLELFGTKKLMEWRFESWNEPDLKTYNKFNFTTEEYLDYLKSLKFGLKAASRRTTNNTQLILRGPAGLFKSKDHHPLCWASLESCNKNPSECPFDILTFHRKGKGHAQEVFDGDQNLLLELFSNYENLTQFPFANDEADPIAGWSTPRPFQSDVRYAVEVVEIILQHWSAMINLPEFYNFESVSHDNAFFSYHPHEFDQRTLFARFQMNLSQPVYSQFIPKPVYTALGMLGNLGNYAKDIESKFNSTILTTSNRQDVADKFFLAKIIISSLENAITNLSVTISLPKLTFGTLAFCLEALETNETSAVEIWNIYGRPNYPNATVRELMRRAQGPRILEKGTLKSHQNLLKFDFNLKSPWIAMLRICSSKTMTNLAPKNLKIIRINNEEVLITWKETQLQPERCTTNFEVQFLQKSEQRKFTNWKVISRGWTVPFLSFHFHPADGIVTGYYKVRTVDIFENLGPFSQIQFFS